MDLTIQHRKTGPGGMFFIEDDGELMAEINYRHSGPDQITITHTGVRPALGGRGVGKKLVTHTVNHARENGLKIVPQCSFAAALFDKFEAWQDVLAR